MGTKSKRRAAAQEGSSSTNNNNSTSASNNNRHNKTRQAPATAFEEKDEETIDNLKFEDPFEDEFEEEEFIVDNNDDVDGEGKAAQGGNGTNEGGDNDEQQQQNDKQKKTVWTPNMGLSPGHVLEKDETAYKMHHALNPEWPSLSFDFIRDEYGNLRTKFPHTVLAVVGTQASKREWNKLQILKMTDLGRTSKARSKKRDDDDESSDDDSEDDSDDDEDNDDDAAMDCNPVLEHMTLNHNGGVNRIRVMPNVTSASGAGSGSETFSNSLQNKRIVSTWSDVGRVNLYDIAPCLEHLDRTAGKFNNPSDPSAAAPISQKPFFTYRGHSTEGYAMDWSKVHAGCLATGDCNGQIHIWNPTDVSYEISCAYDNSTYDGYSKNSPLSIEDIQWSPTEATVLAAGECNGAIQIYDTRRTGKPMITHQAHPNVDVNVLSWNSQVTNLLASGGDDGTLSIWDLRSFGGKKPTPLARFTYSKQPITSVEWHPTDESMIMVTDEQATYLYDLSIEADEEEPTEHRMSIQENGVDVEVEVPPQLLFLHCGSESTKEAHWHPQIPNLVMTTALSGFNLFIPSNL